MSAPSPEVVRVVVERYLQMEDSGILPGGAVAGAVWKAFLEVVTQHIFDTRPVDAAQVSRDYARVRLAATEARRRHKAGDPWPDVTKAFVEQLDPFFKAWERDAKRVLDWERPDIVLVRQRRREKAPLLPEVAAQTGVPVSTLELEGLLSAVMRTSDVRLTKKLADQERAALRARKPMPAIWWRLEEARRALFEPDTTSPRGATDTAKILVGARWNIRPSTVFEYHRRGRKAATTATSPG